MIPETHVHAVNSEGLRTYTVEGEPFGEYAGFPRKSLQQELLGTASLVHIEDNTIIISLYMISNETDADSKIARWLERYLGGHKVIFVDEALIGSPAMD